MDEHRCEEVAPGSHLNPQLFESSHDDGDDGRLFITWPPLSALLYRLMYRISRVGDNHPHFRGGETEAKGG